MSGALALAVIWLVTTGPALPSAADAGAPVRSLSAEDREVLENLDLLEQLEEAADLELLRELARQD